MEDKEKLTRNVHSVLPIVHGVGLEHGIKEVKKGEMPKGEENAYARLRRARSDARYVGVREKREKAKAEAEEAKKK